jgi:hypothetical protein
MLTRLPWVLPLIAGVILCVLFGKVWQRAAAAIVIASFALYLSFTDLLPNGLFRFSNYHYFRWPILLGSMLALVAVIPMFRAGKISRRKKHPQNHHRRSFYRNRRTLWRAPEFDGLANIRSTGWKFVGVRGGQCCAIRFPRFVAGKR